MNIKDFASQMTAVVNDYNSLQEEVIKLREEIALLKSEKEKETQDIFHIWEPQGGDWWINSEGVVIRVNYVNSKYTQFGVRYPTKEAAEKALLEMRIHHRLLAYKMEFCPDYEPDWENEREERFSVFYCYDAQKFLIEYVTAYRTLGTVYFPEPVARELARKLNNGEVVFK